MEDYIICPCCGNQIKISMIDGKLTVFFIAENQDELQKVLEGSGIELANLIGGGNDG